MRDANKCLLPWRMMDKLPFQMDLPWGNHYRPRFDNADSTKVLGAIYAYNRGEFYGDITYWYCDWFEGSNGMKYSSDDLATLMKEVDEKFVRDGYELLTEEDAERLGMLL